MRKLILALIISITAAAQADVPYTFGDYVAATSAIPKAVYAKAIPELDKVSRQFLSLSPEEYISKKTEIVLEFNRTNRVSSITFADGTIIHGPTKGAFEQGFQPNAPVNKVHPTASSVTLTSTPASKHDYLTVSTRRHLEEFQLRYHDHHSGEGSYYCIGKNNHRATATSSIITEIEICIAVGRTHGLNDIEARGKELKTLATRERSTGNMRKLRGIDSQIHDYVNTVLSL